MLYRLILLFFHFIAGQRILLFSLALMLLELERLWDLLFGLLASFVL
jgi:hypothetical protein